MGYKKIASTTHALNAFLDDDAMKTAHIRSGIVQAIFEHNRAGAELADGLLNLEAIAKVKAAGDRFGDDFQGNEGTAKGVWRLTGVSSNRVTLVSHYDGPHTTINLEQWPNPRFIKLTDNGTKQ